MTNPNLPVQPQPEVPGGEFKSSLGRQDSSRIIHGIDMAHQAGLVTPPEDPYAGMHKSLRDLLERGLATRIGGESHGPWPL